MSQLRERSTYATRPLPDEAVLPEQTPGRATAILRTIGAIAVLVVGAVHLQQYLGDYFSVVPIIGPLFLLNFAGATVIGLGLLVPAARLRRLQSLFALGGIGLAATSFVFLFVSEHQPLFGFQDYGYRSAIVIALAAEGTAVVALVAYLATRVRGRT
ncbi:MAG TPA: hypothetical protein VFU33_13215 [Gaiellaceae bacterium]|nr:hypothetical protein [Gaiellaceae bacterium]